MSSRDWSGDLTIMGVKMSLKQTIAFALVAGSVIAAGPVFAQEAVAPHTGSATVTALDANASALTYWVDRADGRHVVTTVDTVLPGTEDSEAHHAVVRFASVLQQGQTQTVSVPAADAAHAHELRIRNLGDHVEVTAVPVSAQSASVD